MYLFNYFHVDFWTLWGFLAQGIFMLSFVVQWYKSEKLKRSHLPYEFWVLRLVASVMLILYVIKRHDIVFLTGILLQIVIYLRNIYLIKEHSKEKPVV